MEDPAVVEDEAPLGASTEEERPVVAIMIHADAKSIFVGAAVAAPRRRSSVTDKCTRSLTLYQFQDNEQLCLLESLLVRVAPSTCHYHPLAASARQARLVALLEALNITASEHKPKSFESIASETAVGELKTMAGEEVIVPFLLRLESSDWAFALRAASVLAKQEGLVRMDAGSFALALDSLDQYMRLDSAALSALNLLPDPRNDRNKEASVHGVLDQTVTKKLGSRLLAKWLRQPLMDANRISARQDQVEALVLNTEVRVDMRAVLKSVPDLDALTSRFEKGRAGLEDMYRLYLFIKSMPQLLACMEKLQSPALNGTAASLRSMIDEEALGKFVMLVEAVVDLDAAPREFLVRAEHDSSGELEQLREERNQVEARVEATCDKVSCTLLRGMDPKFEKDPKQLKTYGYHFRVAKKFDKELKSLDGEYLVVVASGIRWTTSKLKQLYEEHASLTASLNSKQASIVRQAVDTAKTHMPVVEMLAALVAELDVLCSLAQVAAQGLGGGYTRPVVGKSPDVILKQARHPCLERQPDVTFVPNDHVMKSQSSRVQILTGPNMGGKSTYARQLGCLVCMAQIGSFIPAGPGAELPMVDAVLARVGAGDAQLKGVSTFMAEMIEASAILHTVTDRSLVIIDELGRGTSTYDGFGLAWAISERLATTTKALVIFATHFHELTALAKCTEAVCNLHVAAVVEGEKVTMLHEVRLGACENSYGINIARLAGFPEDVLQNASCKVQRLEQFAGLERYRALDDEAERAADEAKKEGLKKKLRGLAVLNSVADGAELLRMAHEVFEA